MGSSAMLTGEPLLCKYLESTAKNTGGSRFHIRLMDKILHELVYLNYGIYGTVLYLGHAELCPSTVGYPLCYQALSAPDHVSNLRASV